jgi:hypothetical protein
MYNQTDDTQGIKTIAIVVIASFIILAVMNVYETIL